MRSHFIFASVALPLAAVATIFALSASTNTSAQRVEVVHEAKFGTAGKITVSGVPIKKLELPVIVRLTDKMTKTVTYTRTVGESAAQRFIDAHDENIKSGNWVLTTFPLYPWHPEFAQAKQIPESQRLSLGPYAE